MIHRFHLRRAGRQYMQSLIYRACPDQRRSHKSRVLHANPAAVIKEGRDALVEECDLVQADARMHDYALVSIPTPNRSRNGLHSLSRASRLSVRNDVE
jgi:hypothetical protein